MVGVCDLCATDGGEVLYRTAQYRIVLVDDPDCPGFCRVIWHHHVREMTDLLAEERTLLVNAVWAVEAAVREVMQPEKVNVASLGNMTPHVHWHVIARYADDAHFPNPVWGQKKRTPTEASLVARREKLALLKEVIVRHAQAVQ